MGNKSSSSSKHSKGGHGGRSHGHGRPSRHASTSSSRPNLTASRGCRKMLEITYDGQPFDLSTISVDGTMVLRGRCTSVWTNHPEPDTGAIRYAQPYFDFAVTNKGEISEEEALSTEFEDKRAAVSTVMTSATMYNLMRQMKSDEMDRDYGSPYDLKYATHKDRNVAIAQQTEQGTRFYRASLKVGTDLEKCTVTSDRFQEMLDAGTVDVVADLDRKEWARF